MNDTITVIITTTVVTLLLALLIYLFARFVLRSEKRRIKKAGKRGESIAADLIEQVLHKEDTLLRNVVIKSKGRTAEFDVLVVNRRGVFIFEVKNYVGRLYGKAKDDTWKKVKTTDAGNSYTDYVDNPLGQLHREEHILGEYLRDNGIRVWVEGYVLFVNNNSPIRHPKIVRSRKDIDNVIHHRRNNALSDDTVKQLRSLL